MVSLQVKKIKSKIFAVPEPEEELAEDPVDEELEEDPIDDPADEVLEQKVEPVKQKVAEKSVQKPTSSQPQKPEPRGNFWTNKNCPFLSL